MSVLFSKVFSKMWRIVNIASSSVSLLTVYFSIPHNMLVMILYVILRWFNVREVFSRM